MNTQINLLDNSYIILNTRTKKSARNKTDAFWLFS